MRSSLPLAALYCICCFAPLLAAEPAFEEAVASGLREATEGDSAGVAVLVARDGKILYQAGFGFADLAEKTPVTPETIFRIGSVTKQFTAAAVLRLAEQEKLSLSDKLNKYFPDYPHGEKISLEQLLTHTSGIRSFTSKTDFYERVTRPIEPAKQIEWFQNDPPDFEPGEGFSYNNSGYFLAGEVVAKVSGKSFGEFLKTEFFEPLEMKNTGIYVNAEPPPGAAKGYSQVEGKYVPALEWDMSWAGGAGALYSTVGDLYRWNEALFGGKVFKPETFQAATTPVKLPPGVTGMNYGYGLAMGRSHRLPTVGHGGGLHGWYCDLVRFPEQHCTVVVLTNASPGPPQLVPSTISHALAARLLENEIRGVPQIAEDKTIDPKTFGEFVGRFDYGTAILTVSLEDSALFAQLTDQPKLQIYPKAKDQFFWKVVDAEISFQRGEKGEIVAVQHSQGGNTFKAAKLAESKVKLSPEIITSILGEYEYGPGAIMKVTNEGEQLFAQLTNQPKMPIFPISDEEFEWHVVEAKVKFVPDAEGKIVKAVHRQNGGTIDAPKIK